MKLTAADRDSGGNFCWQLNLQNALRKLDKSIAKCNFTHSLTKVYYTRHTDVVWLKLATLAYSGKASFFESNGFRNFPKTSTLISSILFIICFLLHQAEIYKCLYLYYHFEFK